MFCECNAYLSAAEILSLKSRDPEALTERIVTCIDCALNCKSCQVKPNVSYPYRDAITSQEIFIMSESQRVREVTEAQYFRIRGEREEGTKGTYHNESGKIFLVADKWCLSTLIHETLHSRSSFSKIPENFEFVTEGITEFLVGRILKNKLPNCFNEWCKLDACFSRGYVQYVKPWLFLSLKFDFTPIKDLYFDIKEEKPLKKRNFS